MSHQFSVEVPVNKIDDDQHLVFGWASVLVNEDGTELVDQQGDVIEIEELEGAVYDFVMSFYAVAGVNHYRPCGQLVESIVFTKKKIEMLGLNEANVPLGWWVGFKIWDNEVWADIKAGKLKMFSIGGSAVRVPEDETEDSEGMS